jgi:hypothetical protein
MSMSMLYRGRRHERVPDSQTLQRLASKGGIDQDAWLRATFETHRKGYYSGAGNLALNRSPGNQAQPLGIRHITRALEFLLLTAHQAVRLLDGRLMTLSVSFEILRGTRPEIRSDIGVSVDAGAIPWVVGARREFLTLSCYTDLLCRAGSTRAHGFEPRYKQVQSCGEGAESDDSKNESKSNSPSRN